MNVFVLIMTIATNGVVYLNRTPQQIIVVKNAEDASMKLKDCNDKSSQWTTCSGELYRVNLSSMTVEKIEIPQVEFKWNIPFNDEMPIIRFR